MFFFERNSSPLFLVTRSSSFSVIHLSVDILDFVVDLTLSLSQVGHAISRQKHLELPVVSYLLNEVFYIGMPVVRTDGRPVGRAYSHVITKISRMDRLLH